MRPFANAAALIADGEPNLSLAWLAGLLEAEGTFLRPTPSDPRLPVVVCRMTDRDVIERVATMFGTALFTIGRGTRRRPEYGTKLKGSRAVLLMTDLAPAMSERRAVAINAAIEEYLPPDRKLDFASAQEIRDLYAGGASVSWLSRTFGVARSTIRLISRGSIYAAPAETPWRASSEDLASTQVPIPAVMSASELYWLAGWLEGEGSFGRPPPSDPRRPRIVAKTRDADVAREVGRLLGVTPLFSHDRRERQRSWSPTWRLLRRGRIARQFMEALHPLMGSRRRLQIENALAAAERL